MDDELYFVVQTDEKQPLKKLVLQNMYGFLYEYSESLSTLALVTHYDSFSVVPDLT